MERGRSFGRAPRVKSGRPGKRKVLLLAGLGTALLLSACSTWEGGGQKVSAYTTEDVNSKLTESMNDFAIRMYGKLELVEDKQGGASNHFVSPASIDIALSMLLSGAQGETAGQIKEMLAVGGMTDERLNEGQEIMIDLLEGSDPSVRMEIANALWLRKGFDIKQPFIDTLRSSYAAKTQALDFDSPKAARTMNKWVDDSTQGLIPQIVEGPIDPQTVMFLMNVMYFKGDWTEPFRPESTRDAAFHPADGNQVTVPTMTQGGFFDYLEQDGFRAVRLPYGEDRNFAMLLALPDEDSDLESFKRESLPEFSAWSGSLEPARGIVALPRFELKSLFELNALLRALGMEDAFAPDAAQFERIADVKPLSVSLVRHAATIKVDEKGSEAAAVTAIAMRAGSAPPKEKPFELRFDRPFFFAITDRTTGLIVFMGEVGNPAEN
ncbi:serpin family protein [Saccharibacillus sp. CPCC 101409]|uniref:serpin family protein n=1 Tax=Saccharibacillus sp. CPCC 101409 TaxID=3058041 RepID=UPI0026723A9A|nr:serpin family protein [Saccharibacillus sp. CPCC 101409]MDO3409483.1 serpin family protein [Saccharibacillus sp. CPCC 101409]